MCRFCVLNTICGFSILLSIILLPCHQGCEYQQRLNGRATKSRAPYEVTFSMHRFSRHAGRIQVLRCACCCVWILSHHQFQCLWNLFSHVPLTPSLPQRLWPRAASRLMTLFQRLLCVMWCWVGVRSLLAKTCFPPRPPFPPPPPSFPHQRKKRR